MHARCSTWHWALHRTWFSLWDRVEYQLPGDGGGVATPGNGVGIIIIIIVVVFIVITIIVVVFITITTVWMDPPPHHHNCHHHNLKMVCGTSEKRRQYRRQTLIRRGKSNFGGEWIDTVTMGKHYLVAIMSHQTELLIVLEGQSCTELKKCLGNGHYFT